MIGEPVLKSTFRPLRLEKFFTKRDCEGLIDSTNGYHQSRTISKDNRIVVDPMTRKSKTRFVSVSDSASHERVIREMNKYMLDSFGVYKSTVQITKYEKTDFFKIHSDALTDDQMPDFGEQRLWTALLYLNDDFKGGQTYFPKIPEIIYPRQGDVIIWPNVDENMKIIQDFDHKSLTVVNGTKYVAVFLFYANISKKNDERIDVV